jgi:hypothetical protein
MNSLLNIVTAQLHSIESLLNVVLKLGIVSEELPEQIGEIEDATNELCNEANALFSVEDCRAFVERGGKRRPNVLRKPRPTLGRSGGHFIAREL